MIEKEFYLINFFKSLQHGVADIVCTNIAPEL